MEHKTALPSSHPCAPVSPLKQSWRRSTSRTGKHNAKAAFKRGFWWPCHTSVPKARWPLSLRSDTWMTGAGRLYQGLLGDREAERISCREHILHSAIYCGHTAHHNLHTINHGVSEAEREWETLSTQQHQDSVGWGQFPSQRCSRFHCRLLESHPEPAKSLLSSIQRVKNSMLYTLQ